MTIKLSFKLIPALGAVNVVKNIPLGEKRMRHHVRLRVTKLIASPSWLFAWLMAWAVLCALTCSAWGGSKTQQVHDPDRVPEGLTAADWNNIRAVHEEQRYALAPSGSGYRAHNPGHQWQTEFDGDGFLIQPEKGDWRWGLELDSYGFPGHEQVVGKAHNRKVEGQRIIYDREENVSEWFVNNQRGLEHGFTIGKRPDGSAENKDPLRFTFSVLGSLRPVISSDGDAVRFVDASGSAVVTYAGLEVWDSDGRSLPAHFVKSEKGIGLIVDECDGRYPITIDPIAQQVYLKASNTGQVGISDGDLFGESVAISGDTAVVGARGESSAATGVNGDQSNNAAVEAGAAYVFVRSGGTWIQQAYLKASNTEALDNFGISVAISGDTLVVGAEKRIAPPPVSTATRLIITPNFRARLMFLCGVVAPGDSRPI